MKPLYIFDIDGTLADLTHRLHFIKQHKPDWDAFHDACDGDKPIANVIKVFKRIEFDDKADIWFFTGRPETHRDATHEWIRQKMWHWSMDEKLTMRPKGNFTPDDQLKEQWLNNMLDVDRERLVAVFDDRDRVCRMFRRNGVTCFQVAEGDF